MRVWEAGVLRAIVKYGSRGKIGKNLDLGLVQEVGCNWLKISKT